ncbi:hypothetical protein CC2G_004069 [Coprinopsis cinerea AmutBmut pab1-1]|nr:hypothetical protein CC2G_004069 [Coprinopsis cinerea AmutBmut pab1-1]
MQTTDIVYDDSDPDQIETLAPTQLHRNVDLELVQADKEGYVKTYIILPSTIYGIADHKLVQLGISNPHSIQIPSLIKASLGRGQAGMVGKGVNRWPNVHIDDVADLYVTLFDAIQSNHPSAGHGREGFYFGENGQHTLYQIGRAIGDAMVALGLSNSSEPTAFAEEELDKYLDGSYYLGSNSQCKANRSRAIGWKPKYMTQDMLDSIKPEVEALVKTGKKASFT